MEREEEISRKAEELVEKFEKMRRDAEEARKQYWAYSAPAQSYSRVTRDPSDRRTAYSVYSRENTERYSTKYSAKSKGVDDRFYEAYEYGYKLEDPKTIFIEFTKGIVEAAKDAIYTLKNSSAGFVLSRAVPVAVAGTIVFNVAGGVFEKPKAQISSDPVIEKEYHEMFVMDRYVTVKVGDNLSTFAEQANCTIDEIKRRNGLSTSNIMIGQTLVIPYYVTDEFIDQYTCSVSYDSSLSLEDFAAQYFTDADTLYNLNSEAVIRTNSGYKVLSSTLVIPRFISKADLKKEAVASKSDAKVYVKK